MTYACLYPESVESLIVIDSAPKDTSGMHKIFQTTKTIIEGAMNYNLTGKTRRQVLHDFKELFVDINYLGWNSCESIKYEFRIY